MPMRMDFSLHQKLGMRMQLSPQIIQSIEILQLPTLELQQRINQEMLENPMLEQEEAELEEAEPTQDTAAEQKADDSGFEKLDDMEDRLREYSSQAPARTSPDGVDPKLEAMQNTAARTITLPEYLAAQLSLLELDAVTHSVAENIAYNLDGNGYLACPLEEMLESMPPGTTLARAERVLRIVQSLDPPGVGARDIRECLLLQLTDGEKYKLERLLVTDHLDDLSANRFPKIVKETGHTLDEVREAVNMICHLSPKPGAVFSTEQPHYVVPDVKIEEADGKYHVTMCDDYVPRLGIARQYVEILRSDKSTTEEKEYIKQKMQAAKWVIDAIEQRRNTIRKIVEEIVKNQQQFFEKGIRFLKPLRMSEIAQAVGVHVSTVSRAISDKYVDTPSGLFAIRFFFAGSAQADRAPDASGGLGSSSASVQDLVRELVEKEDKKKPLSDVDILTILKQRGIDVARRTVTKYRRIMNIPSSRQRMRY